MSITLIVTHADGREEERQLADGRYYIGRDPQANIHLEDESLAPSHALLEVEGEVAFITALSSAEPTLIRNRPLPPFERQPFPLVNIVRIGDIQLAFYVEESLESLPPEEDTGSLDVETPDKSTIDKVIEALKDKEEETTAPPDESDSKGITLPDDIDIGPITEEDKLGGTLSGSDSQPPPPAEDEMAPERIVNTGFASESAASNPIQPTVPLTAERSYYFWLEVGEVIAGSIETERVRLQIDQLPPEAKVDVAIFSFEGELQITPGKDVGTLKILPSGLVRVEEQVEEPAGVDSELLKRRLFFPVATPAQAGTYRLRCNIYYEQLLLQSRLIEAKVVASEAPQPSAEPVLRATADYVLSKNFDTTQLTKIPKHRLSVMLNSNGDGTHGFRFFGQGEFKNDASFGAAELQGLIEKARGALRKASWGDEEPYAPGKEYRYSNSGNLKQLRIDLIRSANRGYRFYDALIGKLSGGQDFELEDLMVKPGQVQLASKEAANLVIPAALFYDRPWHSNQKASEVELCSEFTAALNKSEPLENCRCFQGKCPNYGQQHILCPSGFWGFRHSIGYPVSVATAPDAPVEIKYSSAPAFSVGVSTDPNFVGRAEHENALKALRDGLGWHYADTQDEALAMMKNTESEILYFFCHGGVAQNAPYIQVGDTKSRGIFRDNLRSYRIRWRNTRPLVFINGCHTTALEPKNAINLVSGFIETSHAAGVIGTEITIFVPMAKQFAEAFFQKFVVEGAAVGDAIRSARLHLLKQGNPLGLVYIPYAMTGLRLVGS